VRLWDVRSGICRAILLHLPEGWVAFAPDGRYKYGGDIAGNFWHAINLCRFEVGELDDYFPDLRMADDEPFLQLSAPATSRPRVFISHADPDKFTIRQLIADLKSHGLDAWIDEQDLDVGDSIADGLNQALTTCDHFLIALSPAAVESVWVKRELNTILAFKQKVYPVIIEDCEIPPLLRDIVHADLRGENRDAELQRLVKALSR